MAEKDLIPLTERSEDDQKKIRSMGGKASGQSRRKKKTMREAAQLVLGLRSPEKIKTELKKLGVKNSDAINQTAMIVAVLNKALRGDVRAAEFMRDTAGENPQVARPQSESEDDPLTKSIYETVNGATESAGGFGDPDEKDGDPHDVPAAEKNSPVPGE